MSGFTNKVVKKLFFRKMRDANDALMACGVRAKSSLNALRVIFDMSEKKRYEPPSMHTNLPAFD